MYVCLCNAVTDKQILAAMDQGARSLHDLQKTLQIGTQCGSCCGHARNLVAEYHACMHKSDACTFVTPPNGKPVAF